MKNTYNKEKAGELPSLQTGSVVAGRRDGIAESQDCGQEMPPLADEALSDPFFADLQSVWDDHTRRLDRIAETHAVPTPNYLRSTPFRIKVLVRYAILSVVLLSAAVCWAVVFPSLVFSLLSLLVSLVIEAVYLFFLVKCLYWTVRLIVNNPARVGSLRQSDSPSQTLHTIRIGGENGCVDKGWGLPASPIANLPWFEVVGIAAVIAFATVSCSTTGGDGYAIAQNHLNRAAALENINNIVKQL